MEKKTKKTILILGVLLIIALAMVSYFGAFVESTYARDDISMATQGIGQDLVDLFLVVPLLMIILAMAVKNNRTALLIYNGLLFYVLYSFFIYAFGVHFNQMFLLYCAVLGLSLYSFILVTCEMNRMDVVSWFSGKVPTQLTASFFILIALMFYLLWFKDVVPAIVNDTVPKTVSDYNLLVNPVHVLDIAIALPALLITGVLLFRKHRLAYILTPVFLVFIIILAIALIGMVLMLKAEGISDDTSIAWIFTGLAVISIIVLWMFLQKMKTH